jgi:hypothetical protein
MAALRVTIVDQISTKKKIIRDWGFPQGYDKISSILR